MGCITICYVLSAAPARHARICVWLVQSQTASSSISPINKCQRNDTRTSTPCRLTGSVASTATAGGRRAARHADVNNRGTRALRVHRVCMFVRRVASRVCCEYHTIRTARTMRRTATATTICMRVRAVGVLCWARERRVRTARTGGNFMRFCIIECTRGARTHRMNIYQLGIGSADVCSRNSRLCVIAVRAIPYEHKHQQIANKTRCVPFDSVAGGVRAIFRWFSKHKYINYDVQLSQGIQLWIFFCATREQFATIATILTFSNH